MADTRRKRPNPKDAYYPYLMGNRQIWENGRAAASIQARRAGHEDRRKAVAKLTDRVMQDATMFLYKKHEDGCPFRQHVRNARGVLTVHVCGKCSHCKMVKQAKLIGRAMAEAQGRLGVVCTLTLDDKEVALRRPDGSFILGIDGKPILPAEWYTPEHWQKTIRRLLDKSRKRWSSSGEHSGARLRYVYTAELGGMFDRPHCHLIIFDCPLSFLPEGKRSLDRSKKWWPHGGVVLDKATPAAVRYTVDYITDGDKASKVITYGKSDLLGRRHFEEYVRAMCAGIRKHGARFKRYPDRFVWYRVAYPDSPNGIRLASDGSIRRTATQPLSHDVAAQLVTWGCDYRRGDKGEIVAVCVPQLEAFEIEHRTYPFGKSEREWLQRYGFLERDSDFLVGLGSEIDRGLGEATRSERLAASSVKEKRRREMRAIAKARQQSTVRAVVNGVEVKIDAS